MMRKILMTERKVFGKFLSLAPNMTECGESTVAGRSNWLRPEYGTEIRSQQEMI
jgi:hypothetical protein